MKEQTLERLEGTLPPSQTAVTRDLNLNLKRLFSEGSLGEKEFLFALLATAQTAGAGKLAAFAADELRAREVPADLIVEARESAAIMAMLNTYYRFRHMIGKDQSKLEQYREAKLRMTSLARPVLGKETFEMLAFAVSVINGCETCIVSHEKALVAAGVTVEQVHDLARIAAVVRGLGQLPAL